MMAAQFSKDGNYCAQLSTDGKLKIWKAATSSFEQEFIPDFHLTSPCTCFQIIQPISPTSKNGSPRKKKRRDSESLSPYIILGTNSGLLLVYSIAKASLDYSINSGSGQSVSCLSWEGGNLVYSGVEQSIFCWNLAEKRIKSKWKLGNEKITAILLITGCTQLLTASRSIKLWDIESKELLRTFTGHSYDVSILQYVNLHNTGAYFISASKGDRLLSCWNLNEESSDKNAVACLLMEDIAYSVSVVIRNGGPTNIAAVTRSGVVHVYQHTLNGKCYKPLKPKTTIRVASNVGQKSLVSPIPIVGAFLKEEFSVVVGYGNELFLVFENIVLNEYEKIQCLIRNDPRTLQTSKENEISKIRTPNVDSSVHYLTPHTSNTISAKRKNEGRQEIPMEIRLENLALNKLDSSSKVPKVDNVSQLLVQGLHSKDKNILRNVLSRRDVNVIKNTVKRLPLPVIGPLIKELTSFIQGKTVSSQIGVLWLNVILQVHAGILLSNPELSDLLGPILGSIESRLSLQQSFNRLRGRLDLLVTQVNTATTQDTGENSEALLVYDDKVSSDSEIEGIEIAAHSDSDNEWREESSEEEIEVEENKDVESDEMST